MAALSIADKQARDSAFDIVRRLNAERGGAAYAVSGALAFAAHGIQLSRPLGDVDIAAIEPIVSASGLRRALKDAGCENLASQRSFREVVRRGRVSFVRDGIDHEILCQHDRAAKANPLQAHAAQALLDRCRVNLRFVDDVPVLDVDVIVAWKAILDREKDRLDIQDLVKKTRSDGTPAIRNRDIVLQLVIENCGKHASVVGFLDSVMWDPWHGY